MRTEQANEHNKKQDYVDGERNDNIISAVLCCVGNQTGTLRRYPVGAVLRLDEPGRFRKSRRSTDLHDTCFRTELVRNCVPECQQDGLAMNEECNLSQPCAHCDRNDNVILVPNRNPDAYMSLLQGDNRNAWKTYVRIAIKSVAQATEL